MSTTNEARKFLDKDANTNMSADEAKTLLTYLSGGSPLEMAKKGAKFQAQIKELDNFPFKHADGKFGKLTKEAIIDKIKTAKTAAEAQKLFDPAGDEVIYLLQVLSGNPAKDGKVNDELITRCTNQHTTVDVRKSGIGTKTDYITKIADDVDLSEHKVLGDWKMTGLSTKLQQEWQSKSLEFDPSKKESLKGLPTAVNLYAGVDGTYAGTGVFNETKLATIVGEVNTVYESVKAKFDTATQAKIRFILDRVGLGQYGNFYDLAKDANGDGNKYLFLIRLAKSLQQYLEAVKAMVPSPVKGGGIADGTINCDIMVDEDYIKANSLIGTKSDKVQNDSTKRVGGVQCLYNRSEKPRSFSDVFKGGWTSVREDGGSSSSSTAKKEPTTGTKKTATGPTIIGPDEEGYKKGWEGVWKPPYTSTTKTGTEKTVTGPTISPTITTPKKSDIDWKAINDFK